MSTNTRSPYDILAVQTGNDYEEGPGSTINEVELPGAQLQRHRLIKQYGTKGKLIVQRQCKGSFGRVHYCFTGRDDGNLKYAND